MLDPYLRDELGKIVDSKKYGAFILSRLENEFLFLSLLLERDAH